MSFIPHCLKMVLFFSLTYSSCFSLEATFIPHPQNYNYQIEFFVSKPEGKGPFPVMFLLQPYQSDKNNIGGKEYVDNFTSQKFVNEGIIAVAISTPGFGHSDGERDYCGEFSQSAIIGVIDHFKKMEDVDLKKLGLYGISRGAILGSLVSAQVPDLNLQVLESGFYDLASTYHSSPEYIHHLLKNLIVEHADSDEGLKSRSIIFHAQDVKAKTLLLQGELDPLRGLPSALTFQRQLQEAHVPCELITYPALHQLPNEKWEVILLFIRKHFFNLYGIGINFESFPILQVSKIHPSSPADKSGKLRIGDVILKVSPHNDSVEYDALKMPRSQFIRYLLGQKGSNVRLYVQHYDLSYETIVIERG